MPQPRTCREERGEGRGGGGGGGVKEDYDVKPKGEGGKKAEKKVILSKRHF